MFRNISLKEKDVSRNNIDSNNEYFNTLPNLDNKFEDVLIVNIKKNDFLVEPTLLHNSSTTLQASRFNTKILEHEDTLYEYIFLTPSVFQSTDAVLSINNKDIQRNNENEKYEKYEMLLKELPDRSETCKYNVSENVRKIINGLRDESSRSSVICSICKKKVSIDIAFKLVRTNKPICRMCAKKGGFNRIEELLDYVKEESNKMYCLKCCRCHKFREINQFRVKKRKNVNKLTYCDINIKHSEKPKAKKIKNRVSCRKNRNTSNNYLQNADIFLDVPYHLESSSSNSSSSHSKISRCNHPYDNCSFCNSIDKRNTKMYSNQISSINPIPNSNEDPCSIFTSSFISNNNNESVEIVDKLENRLSELHSILFNDNDDDDSIKNSNKNSTRSLEKNKPENIKIVENNIIIKEKDKKENKNENKSNSIINTPYINYNNREIEENEKNEEEEEKNLIRSSSLSLSFDYPISSLLTSNSIESIKQYLLSITNKENEKKNILNNLKIILLDLLENIEKILNPEINENGSKDSNNNNNNIEKDDENKNKMLDNMSNEELIAKINELNEIINGNNERIKELESSKKSIESLEYDMIKTREENDIKLKEIKNDLEYEYYNKRKELENEYNIKYEKTNKENTELREIIKKYEEKIKKVENKHNKEIDKEKGKNESLIKEYEKTISELENKLKLLNESHEKYINELKEYYEKEIDSMIKPEKLNQMLEYKCNNMQEEMYNNNKIIIERLKSNYEKKIKDLTEFYENKNTKKKSKSQSNTSSSLLLSSSLPENKIIKEIKNTMTRSLSSTLPSSNTTTAIINSNSNANTPKSNTLTTKTNRFSSSSHNSTKTCIKCGLNDFLSPNVCTFHPFLAKGGGNYVYGKEWERCKNEHHNKDSKGCFTRNFHVYDTHKTRLSSKFSKNNNNDNSISSGDEINNSNNSDKSETSINIEESSSDKDEVDVLKIKTNKTMMINKNGSLDIK